MPKGTSSRCRIQRHTPQPAKVEQCTRPSYHLGDCSFGEEPSTTTPQNESDPWAKTCFKPMGEEQGQCCLRPEGHDGACSDEPECTDEESKSITVEKATANFIEYTCHDCSPTDPGIKCPRHQRFAESPRHATDAMGGGGASAGGEGKGGGGAYSTHDGFGPCFVCREPMLTGQRLNYQRTATGILWRHDGCTPVMGSRAFGEETVSTSPTQPKKPETISVVLCPQCWRNHASDTQEMVKPHTGCWWCRCDYNDYGYRVRLTIADGYHSNGQKLES
jgi:hypothetical protein